MATESARQCPRPQELTPLNSVAVSCDSTQTSGEETRVAAFRATIGASCVFICFLAAATYYVSSKMSHVSPTSADVHPSHLLHDSVVRSLGPFPLHASRKRAAVARKANPTYRAIADHRTYVKGNKGLATKDDHQILQEVASRVKFMETHPKLHFDLDGEDIFRLLKHRRDELKREKQEEGVFVYVVDSETQRPKPGLAEQAGDFLLRDSSIEAGFPGYELDIKDGRYPSGTETSQILGESYVTPQVHPITNKAKDSNSLTPTDKIEIEKMVKKRVSQMKTHPKGQKNWLLVLRKELTALYLAQKKELMHAQEHEMEAKKTEKGYVLMAEDEKDIERIFRQRLKEMRAHPMGLQISKNLLHQKVYDHWIVRKEHEISEELARQKAQSHPKSDKPWAQGR